MNGFRLAASLLCAALIGGCGGGGSNDDGGNSNASFTLETSAVSFSSRSDDDMGPGRTIEATAKNGTVFLEVTYGGGPGSPIAGAALNTSLLSATARIQITAKSGRTLGAGVFTDTITVRGCRDSSCSSQVEGSPKRITVTHTVSEAPPGITLGAATLDFSAIRGQLALPSQDVTVTADGGASVEYTTSVSYSSVDGATDWLSVPATATATNALRVGVNSTALAGTHLATLTLTPTNTAQPKKIIIRYTVTQPTLAFSPAAVGFTVTGTSPRSALQQIIRIAGTGDATLSWTATASQGWIGLSSSSGSSGDQLTVSVNTESLEARAPGTYSGTVSFNFNGTHTGMVQLPVQLELRLPSVSLVAPYVALAGTTDPVIVRGAGFDNMTTERVFFGTDPATAVTRISATELRVTPPVLSAGRYSVTIENQLDARRTLADLVAVDPVAYPYAAHPSSGGKSRIIYDAERRSLYVCNLTNERIERYTFNAGVWTRTTSMQFGGLRTMALAPDGSEITIVSSALTSLDPISFAATFRPGSLLFGDSVAEHMEYGNHGWAVITSSGTGVDSVSAAYNFRTHSVLGAIASRRYYSARLSSPRDGSRIIIASKGGQTIQPVYYEDASTGQTFATSLMRKVESLASDRTGDRLVLVGVAATEVFDRDFSLLGNLPSTTLAAVLTPNARRAYTYDSGGSVRAFDLTATLGSNASSYPEIGSPTPLADAPGTWPVMTISPDSSTLFIAGNERVMIVPAP